jgi:membrane protein insertase Oxa1/YidC/SpoIIIJ
MSLGRFLRAKAVLHIRSTLHIRGRFGSAFGSISAAGLPPAAATVAPAVENLHSIPGSSAYGSHEYSVLSDTPYPIWMLEPNGATYQTVLWLARHSSELLNSVHDASGLPWWATILAFGAATRLALLPFTLYSLRNVARSADAQEDIQALVQGFRQAVATPGMTPSSRAGLMPVLLRGLNAALRKVRCYPWHTLAVPFLQVPIMVTGVLGARHSVLLGNEAFEVEGTAWFPDLTIADPYFGLPVLALGLAYASMEVIFGSRRPGARRTTGGAALLGARLANTVKSGAQMCLLASVPLSVTLPAGLYLLMSANSVWTILQVRVVERRGERG